LRSIIFILTLLSVYFGICIFIGIKWAFVFSALFMIALATMFLIKKESYLKYGEIMNPRGALLYKSKDDSFRKKYRITHIIGLYILSAILLLTAVPLPNTTMSIHGRIFIYLVIATLLSTIVIWCLSELIFKRSKKNSTFWFYFIGSALFILLVLTIIENFIF